MPRKKKASKPVLFCYTARDDSGRVISGTSTAASKEEIVRRLREKGYQVEVSSVQEAEGVRPPKIDPADEPIRRVSTVILEQAEKDQAGRIRITCPRDSQQCTVSYCIGDTWHEVLSVPSYVWPPLRDRFAALSKVKLNYGVAREPASLRQSVLDHQVEYTATFRRNRVMLERKM